MKYFEGWIPQEVTGSIPVHEAIKFFFNVVVYRERWGIRSPTLYSNITMKLNQLSAMAVQVDVVHLENRMATCNLYADNRCHKYQGRV
ncbi:hypothetical protein SAMN05661012_00353 [Chitinophaga sancti]|uniref:Uncharacterized protein n=1 Tax=Chitinophaga sancti TaxID=1004 RepID=A0A1K1M0J4_9BACT|nr:hypothetical protein SAMN05661012_00353 [Chitinophaga sancti]